MFAETYPNEGPLWPCGCLVGNPACRCGEPSPETRDSETEAQRDADECPCRDEGCLICASLNPR